MPFKPGEKRAATAGRRRGTTNKRTLDLVCHLEDLGFDPVAKLVLIFSDAMDDYATLRGKTVAPGNDTAAGFLKIAESACADIMPYMYPKRKAVEVTGEDGKDLFQSFGQFVKNLADDGKLK